MGWRCSYGSVCSRYSKTCGIVIAIDGFEDYEINIRGLEDYSTGSSGPIPNIVDSTETPEDSSCEEDFTPNTTMRRMRVKKLIHHSLKDPRIRLGEEIA